MRKSTRTTHMVLVIRRPHAIHRAKRGGAPRNLEVRRAYFGLLRASPTYFGLRSSVVDPVP